MIYPIEKLDMEDKEVLVKIMPKGKLSEKFHAALQIDSKDIIEEIADSDEILKYQRYSSRKKNHF